MEVEKMTNTVVIEEPEVNTPEATPTREELRGKGWTKDELDAAEKRGMIKDKEEKKEEPKPEAKPDLKVVDGKTEEGEEKPEQKKSSLPDFTFQTPEQEKAFLEAFGPGTPQRAMYFRMKNERTARQSERAARERVEKELQETKERLAALEKFAQPKEVDEDGNIIDPDEKPLTRKQLLEYEKQKQEEAAKKQRELNEQARNLADAQTAQEEYARNVFPDFDSTVELAKDVMKNLEKYVPERWKQAQAIRMIQDLQVAALNADKIDLDDYNAAVIAYEIGKLHPQYGQKADSPAKPNGDASDKDGKLKDPKKANGSLTPEQMKRIEENTQRRASSASIQGGGGKRVISAEDVDLATLTKMNYRERQAFREKHPEQYARLQRG